MRTMVGASSNAALRLVAGAEALALRAALRASVLRATAASGSAGVCAALAPLASAILSFLRPPPPAPPLPALCLSGIGALEGVPAWAVEAALQEEAAGGAPEPGSGGSGEGLLGRLLRRVAAPGGGGLLEALTSHIWMAVPKRKTSYSRKRQRQMNPLYARKNLLNFYPCPKCDKGLLKLRHHLCPCDQEKANISGVKKVRTRPLPFRAPLPALGLPLPPFLTSPSFFSLSLQSPR